MGVLSSHGMIEKQASNCFGIFSASPDAFFLALHYVNFISLEGLLSSPRQLRTPI